MRARLERVRRLTTVIALASLAACRGPRDPVDLLRAGDRLVEARAASLDKVGVLQGFGKPLRINDVVRRTLPAGPPGRLVFRLDVPKAARLGFSCAVAPEFQGRPGVEFVVKARKSGREDVLFSKLVDPLSHPEHRSWVTAEIDLARYAGREVELILETRGFDPAGDPGQAVWGTPAVTVARPDAPLVVIYLVDTLRADHTGVYGYGRDTTPHLDAFARDGIVFEQAVAHASWTKPSVASIFTSLLPGQHRAVQLRDPLDPGHVTIAQMLNAKGYATGAAIANSVIYGAESSFDRGFDFFAGLHGEGDRPSKLVGAEGVVDAALSWLDARRGFPTFLYVHTMDPHVPYAPPPPFDRKYEPHPTEGHPAQDPRTDYKEPLDRERMIAQYDGDIAYGDQEFGSLPARAPRPRPLRGGDDRLPGRPRRGVPGPREVAARADRLRRARPHSPGGQAAASARGRPTRLPAGAGGGRPAHGAREPGAARPGAARHRRTPSPARARGTGRQAARNLRDQPPRLRGPRRAHGGRQVHPPLRSGDRRALLRSRQGPGRADERPGRPPRARAPAQGTSGSRHVPESLPLRGAGRRLLGVRARPRDRRLDRGRGGHGPRAERTGAPAGERAAPRDPRAPPSRASLARSRSRCALGGRP